MSAAYDSKGRITSFTGPRTDVSQTTSYTYYPDDDASLTLRGQLETVTNAVSQSVSYGSAASPYNGYNIYGGARSYTDANGVVTEAGYDQLGRVTTLILKGVSGDPDDLTTTFTYDPDGNLTSVTSPNGNQLGLSYDTTRRLTDLTRADASGNQHEQLAFAYNAVSQLTSQSAAYCDTPATTCASWTTAWSRILGYTTNGALENVTYPTGLVTYLWDKYGNNTGAQFGDSSYSYAQTLGYDGAHQATSSRLSGYSIASYVRDLGLNVAGVTSPSTASTSYFYDDFGCLKKEQSPYQGTSTFTCDPAGNVTSYTDANGATTTRTFDALNRPLTSSSSRSGESTESTTWTYDDATSGHYGIGRLASMTDPSGNTTYAYERRGLLASTVQTVNETAYTTTYAYDGDGNQTTINLPSGRTLTYTFDFADRPESVSSGDTTYVSSATYEPFGPRSQTSYGNGTEQTITYDERYLPTEMKVTNSSGTLSDLSYTTNAAGFVTTVTDNLNSGYDRNYAYGGKAGNALIKASTGSSLWGTATYSDTYSQNLLTSDFPGRNLSFVYNRIFQLTSVNNSSTSTRSAVTHDAYGNETGLGSASYTYSPRELLASGDGVDYTYDGFGRRVTATASAGTRVSLYDPQMHLQSESSLSSGSIAYDYIWFGGLPVAQENVGGSTHWTADDERGAPFMQTDSSGNTYWQADYEPFGAIADLRTTDAHQPLRLPGQESEEFSTADGPNGLTGRYYNGFRWYRSQAGRYTQPDPVGYWGSTYNLYAYVGNNPTNYIDALGLSCSQAPPGAPPSHQGGRAPPQRDNLPPGAAPPWASPPGSSPPGGSPPDGGFGGFGGSGWSSGLPSWVVPALAAVLVSAAVFVLVIAFAPEILAAATIDVAGSEVLATAGDEAAAPDFVVTPGGDVIPVPEGATGPVETRAPGFQYNGGSGGGNGLADNVTDVRIMEPNAKNPTGYVNYGSRQADGGWQSVNPYSGEPLAPSNPWWHIPITPIFIEEVP